MMWAFIFIFMFAAFIAACIYLITRVRKIALVDKLAKDRKWLSILISALTCVVFIVVLSLAMGYINAIIVTIYMILFWLVCEFAFWLVGKVKNRMKSTAGETTESNIIKNNAESSVKPKKRKIYYAGVTAIIITIVYMSWGWYQAHNVWQKDYTIHTDKAVGSIKLALIADSHTGTTFDGEGFAEHVKAIQAQNPDAVLIAGDFVDDDTSLIDMKKCCEALGTLDTKYGVYYVFGNHDKGYYASERRGYLHTPFGWFISIALSFVKTIITKRFHGSPISCIFLFVLHMWRQFHLKMQWITMHMIPVLRLYWI